MDLDRAWKRINVQNEASVIVLSEEACKEIRDLTGVTGAIRGIHLEVREHLQHLLLGQVLERAFPDLDEGLSTIVAYIERSGPIELVGVLEVVGLLAKLNVVGGSVGDEALAELRVPERGVLDVDSGAAVLAYPRHEPLRDVIRIVHGHLHVVVRLDLDQCLLVMEILEVAVVEMERRRVRQVAMHRVERVQIEEHAMPRRVRLVISKAQHVKILLYVQLDGIEKFQDAIIGVRRLCKKIFVVRLSWARTDAKRVLNELLRAGRVNLCRNLIQSCIEARIARVVESIADTLHPRDVDRLKITCRFVCVLAELEWRCIDYILHELRVVPFYQLHKVVFPRELYILELREVCDIESRAPMHSDLRLRVASLKIDTILVKGLLRPESGHVEEVVLR